MKVRLSPREEQIVELAAEGLPNKIIADRLAISVWTVGTHLRRIFSKLDVSSKTGMVARYLLAQNTVSAVARGVER